MQIQRETSVPANDVVENVFSGSAFEFPPGPVAVSCGAVGAAAGLFITITVGGQLILEESPPAVSADFPLIPDEFYYNFFATNNQRIVLRARNSTGAAVILRSLAMMAATR